MGSVYSDLSSDYGPHKNFKNRRAQKERIQVISDFDSDENSCIVKVETENSTIMEENSDKKQLK